ncbi:GST [Mytilus edulis]|uniref:GST n=1 Tax=Mytilus edulis TaxID=6550 RepID=A0A8S3U8Y2_MYTED|nr:GST [Mytilus edulis]
MLVCLCFRQKPEEIVVRTKETDTSEIFQLPFTIQFIAPAAELTVNFHSNGKRTVWRSKGTPTLYIHGLSAPARAAWMTTKAAEIPVHLKYVDPFKGEHKTPEFAKINPDMTLPTLVDGNFSLWESRPVMQYLVSKFGGRHSYLYPKDLRRAIVDRLLYYDLGSVYKTVTEYMYPQLFQGKPLDAEKEMAMRATFDYLNRLFDGGGHYMTGDNLTIADISMASNISLTEIKGYRLDAWPDLATWYQRMKAQPWWPECNKGLYEWKSV